MLVGHFAVGLAARRIAPKAPMALLLTAPLVLDLLWPLFFFTGIERFEIDQDQRAFLVLELIDVPWSHGLVASIFWAALLAVPYFLWRRDARGAWVLGALVLSHWVLDVVTHQPDMPLWWGGPRLGLGLWYSTIGTVVVELLFTAACVFLFVRAQPASGPSGVASLWVPGALMMAVYLHSAFGAPPPGAAVAAGAGLSLWLTPLWGWWLDRARLREETAAPAISSAT